MKRFGRLLFITTLLCASSAWAQPTARITTMQATQGSSQAQLTVQVKCNDIVQYILTSSQLSITDNGEPVEEISIVESSSPAVRNLFSAALVLDASGSMSGTGNAGTKAAASDFVNFMDGVADEAAVLWFNTTVSLQQGITTSKSSLQSAVSALPASGGTAVWDAAYQGVQLVAASANNSKQSVLLLTDGGDNSSTHTPSEVILLAQQYNVRVFTIGLGSAINATTLEMIALLTGGAYFQTPNAVDLQSIFTTIANFMGRGFDEHTVAYVTPDPDAAEHVIEVRVRVCDDVASATHSEKATGVTSASYAQAALPATVALDQNAPNPFATNTGTTIPFRILGSTPQYVTLEVFDLLGRRVATLTDGMRSAGSHRVSFSAEGLSRGMYLYRLSSGETVLARRMLVR